MSFNSVKFEERQAQAVAFGSCDIYLHQRTQLTNELREHLAEFGVLLSGSRESVARME